MELFLMSSDSNNLNQNTTCDKITLNKPWLTKFLRRIIALAPGRYQIILSVNDNPDWTVIELGKIEKSK